jgi:chromosome segregation ATPase
VLTVDYRVHDACTGDEFSAFGEFVSGLHQHSWIVQIRWLKKRRRNDLEKILSIFDQSGVTDIRYILNVDEESYPEAYRQIIRRLRKAMEDPQKRREMELEDDIVKELQDKERQIEEKSKAIIDMSKAIADKDQTIADKDQAIADKDQTIADKDQTIADKDQAIADKDQAIVELEKKVAALMRNKDRR